MKLLTLCRPCAEKLGQAYELTRIVTGSEKATCDECGRRRYLEARVDYANGEYDKYQNTMQMFNAFFGEFVRWFATIYSPADTHGEVYYGV